MRRILREPEEKKKTGLSRSTRGRLEKKGLYPKRVKISPNGVGRFEDEIDEYLNSRPRVNEKREG